MPVDILKCFQTLGLEPGVSLQTVKATYRNLVKAWHPDRFHNDPPQNEKAHSILKEVNPAYKSLLLFYEGRLFFTYQEPVFDEPKNAVEQFELGARYAKGDGVPQDNFEAVRWIRKAAEQGYAKAQHCLGILFYWGDKVARDSDECIKWFRKAAKQNHEPSRIWLEDIYEDAWGAPKDFSAKMRWYREAAGEGFKSAQKHLGYIYSYGDDIPKDYWEAIKWYLMAAEQGDPDAQSSLGYLYKDAERFKQKHDYKRAFYWLIKAAEFDDETSLYSSSRYAIGEMYENGMGVTQNYAEALKWYLKATQGLIYCWYKIGQMYEEGKGTDQNFAEAAHWYREAAIQGWSLAQVKLAKMYKEGRGVRKNKTASIKWYKLAVKNGYSTPGFEGKL